MSLGRLLAAGLSAASSRLRSLSTTVASHPPWVMVWRVAQAYKSEPPTFRLAEPPLYSHLMMPTDLIYTSDEPGPDSDLEQLLGGLVSSSSGADGLLLVTCCDGRVASSIVEDQEGKQVLRRTVAEGHVPGFTYLVCNPLSGEVLRVPKLWGTTKALRDSRVGILAQADRAYGLPDRFAVAMSLKDGRILRFRSDTGKWDVTKSAWEHPLAQGIKIGQEAVAFCGRLWWVDLRYGAISADPFRDWTETNFVELPKGSVLPVPEAQGAEAMLLELRNYRRIGVSQGRLRYVEVSQRYPFVLSSFTLDEEDRGEWTLEHRVALSRVWAADGGGQPLQAPQICVLDPLNASVIHVIVGEHVVAVDMDVGKVTGSSLLPPENVGGFIPCLLRSRRIPPCTGKDIVKNQAYADVLVHSDWSDDEY